MFREQHLSPPQLLEAVQMFGEIFPQHNSRFSLPECPLIHYISNQDFDPDGNATFRVKATTPTTRTHAEPPKATVLHAVKLPITGGDTQFVNMHAAYEDLPDETNGGSTDCGRVHVYQSRHSERKLMAARRAEAPDDARWRAASAGAHASREAGARRSISIRSVSRGSSAWSERGALALLDELLAHATQPRYEYRHRWRPATW